MNTNKFTMLVAALVAAFAIGCGDATDTSNNPTTDDGTVEVERAQLLATNVDSVTFDEIQIRESANPDEIVASVENVDPEEDVFTTPPVGDVCDILGYIDGILVFQVTVTIESGLNTVEIRRSDVPVENDPPVEEPLVEESKYADPRLSWLEDRDTWDAASLGDMDDVFPVEIVEFDEDGELGIYVFDIENDNSIGGAFYSEIIDIDAERKLVLVPVSWGTIVVGDLTPENVDYVVVNKQRD